MQKRIRKVLTSLKEHSTVSYAKFATAGGFCDVELIIVKATAPDDLPVPERYIQELLQIFLISPSSFHSFIVSFCRRFTKTHCWLVAVKCLLLLHRLLRLLPETSLLRSALIWFRTNGLLRLHPCDFRDDYSSSASESYTAFVKSYARLLDETLDCFYDFPDETLESLSDKINRIVEFLPQIQSLIDRVTEIDPTGCISRSFAVRSAIKYVILDSFLYYTTFRRENVFLLENLLQMPYKSCISAFEIYKKSALQATKLTKFYDWCKRTGICIGLYRYPFIDKIPQIQIQALESFLNGMWQLSDSSSSATSSLVEESSSSRTTDDDHKQLVVNTQWVNFDDNDFYVIKEETFPRRFALEDEEQAPLIQFEDDSWMDILDASISLSQAHPSRDLFDSFSFEIGSNDIDRKDRKEQWEVQEYNPNGFNPFYRPY
ncbi:hypothetical protein ACFE04_020559 [Oxalis oulophora]